MTPHTRADPGPSLFISVFRANQLRDLRAKLHEAWTANLEQLERIEMVLHEQHHQHDHATAAGTNGEGHGWSASMCWSCIVELLPPSLSFRAHLTGWPAVPFAVGAGEGFSRSEGEEEEEESVAAAATKARAEEGASSPAHSPSKPAAEGDPAAG